MGKPAVVTGTSQLNDDDLLRLPALDDEKRYASLGPLFALRPSSLSSIRRPRWEVGGTGCFNDTRR
jgi:hypothetical protein